MPALNWLVKLRMEAGWYAQALEPLNTLIQLQPKEYVHCTNRSFAYLALEEFELAFADLDLAAERAPDKAARGSVHLSRAFIYEKMNQVKAAKQELQAAIRLLPKKHPNMLKCIEKLAELSRN